MTLRRNRGRSSARVSRKSRRRNAPGAFRASAEHAGEPLGLAPGRQHQSIVPAGGGVGDLAGRAAGLGSAAVAILLGPRDRLATIAPRPRGVGEGRGHGRGRRHPAEAHRNDRDPQALLVGERLDRSPEPIGDLGPPGREQLVDPATRQGPRQRPLGRRPQSDDSTDRARGRG